MAKPAAFTIQKTDAQWREVMTPEQYNVARKEGTERPFTSEHNDEKRRGVYHCVGCGSARWSSSHKFDSGTGWPSYFQPITPEAVTSKTDWKLLYPRTECHCSTCGAHQGHVFPDGPAPTGQRWCINGVVLTFRPTVAA